MSDTSTFQMVPVPCALVVRGNSEAESVGEFEGTVLAIGLRDTDPVAAVVPDQVKVPEVQEGMLGYGTTHFLVADASKPAPVWVGKDEVTEHEVQGLSVTPTTG